MSFSYVSTAQAQQDSGLRMIVVGGVPSPWGEAAKGLFHVKNLPWCATRLAYDEPAQAKWAGVQSAPVVFWQDEPPLTEALQILDLTQRIAPDVDLVPEADATDIRALVARMAAPGGLGWQRRLQLVHGGMMGAEGFQPKVSQYLASKYGYSPERGEGAGAMVQAILGEMSATLADGRTYYFGDRLTAADIYAATFLGLFKPLPEDQCAMKPATRSAFETLDEATRAALDPALISHRDRIYAEALELPLAL